MNAPLHAADGTPDPASRGETLRQHLQHVIDLHTPLNPKNPYCPTCGHPGEHRHPCETKQHAVAALASLDRSERTVIQCGITGVCEYDALGKRVLVYDPLSGKGSPGIPEFPPDRVPW